MDKSCDLRKWQGLLGAGIVIFFLISPLITSYFCCCATRPLVPGQVRAATTRCGSVCGRLLLT